MAVTIQYILRQVLHSGRKPSFSQGSPGVLAQGEDIGPLVGTRRPDRWAEGVAALGQALSGEQWAKLETAIPPDAVAGERYAPAQMAMLDSER